MHIKENNTFLSPEGIGGALEELLELASGIGVSWEEEEGVGVGVLPFQTEPVAPKNLISNNEVRKKPTITRGGKGAWPKKMSVFFGTKVLTMCKG